MCSYFCFDCVVTADEMGITSAYDEEGDIADICGDQKVFPAIGSLPMRFTHALDMCHS